MQIAVVSFPGNNCEVESLRAIREAGMEPLSFRWNDDRKKLRDVDGYFIPGGFTYEDRGRSGMVAGRDPLMDFIGREAELGKAVIGHCNGAQILVESGLIPLGKGLHMSLARNAFQDERGWHAPGFINEWVWIKPTCARERAATSDWEGVLPLPIAHGEGRFTTNDADLFKELHKNDQIAFAYCDALGNVSTDPEVTPNGSMHAIAGICNPAGNVVALMPHPERTLAGKPYFQSLRRWCERPHAASAPIAWKEQAWGLSAHKRRGVELFIDTVIVNNEERTVEQAARGIEPNVKVKQWKYFSLPASNISALLADLSLFNAHKERAFLRRGTHVERWNGALKRAEGLNADEAQKIFSGIHLIRRDIPDVGARSLGPGATAGICYALQGISEKSIGDRRFLEVFFNPHSSTLERLS